jgi:DNA-binding PadR family transcriptional regulator
MDMSVNDMSSGELNMRVEHLLPLQEPTLYILLSLRSGEKHGYAILKEVAELSKGQLKLSTGTLYGALYRLLDQGIVEQISLHDGPRGKKTYRLTQSGLEVLNAEMNRMRKLLLLNGWNLPEGAQE